MEAIILAGGLGTRLRSAVADLPKCMAPVAGKPFIHHVVKYMQSQGVTRFIFSLGYLHDVIQKDILENFPTLDLHFSIEDEPLGTGGAIKKACTLAKSGDIIILNGDTLFRINAKELMTFHNSENCACSLTLKPMTNFDRYGVVKLDDRNRVTSFLEKKAYDRGLINGGVYALNISSFLNLPLPEKFSFEKEYLETYYKFQKMSGLVQEGYFIDIGIPEDFHRADRELRWIEVNDGSSLNLPIFNKELPKTDSSWTLFLDRDGVLNHEKFEDYVHFWEEFRFLDSVPAAMKILKDLFGRIIVVTNQRGVGKGVTKEQDLHNIHQNMQHAVATEGGRIDKVYYCSDIDNNSNNRKPNPGMGFQASHEFKEISFEKAVMVGNTLSDMDFARNLKMYSVFLPTTRPDVDLHDHRIDAVFSSLIQFALEIKEVSAA